MRKTVERIAHNNLVNDNDFFSACENASAMNECTFRTKHFISSHMQSASSSRRRIASILASVATQARGLKRVGSAHNLAPPGADPKQSGGNHVSRSLPPSPQHSPSHSRKVFTNPLNLPAYAASARLSLKACVYYPLVSTSWVRPFFADPDDQPRSKA